MLLPVRPSRVVRRLDRAAPPARARGRVPDPAQQVAAKIGRVPAQSDRANGDSVKHATNDGTAGGFYVTVNGEPAPWCPTCSSFHVAGQHFTRPPLKIVPPPSHPQLPLAKQHHVKRAELEKLSDRELDALYWAQQKEELEPELRAIEQELGADDWATATYYVLLKRSVARYEEARRPDDLRKARELGVPDPDRLPTQALHRAVLDAETRARRIAALTRR